jgi:hypothetical protein
MTFKGHEVLRKNYGTYLTRMDAQSNKWKVKI